MSQKRRPSKDERYIEKLRLALWCAYDELCEIERLNTTSKEQALRIVRAIGFCKWDKEPEWSQRLAQHERRIFRPPTFRQRLGRWFRLRKTD